MKTQNQNKSAIVSIMQWVILIAVISFSLSLMGCNKPKDEPQPQTNQQGQTPLLVTQLASTWYWEKTETYDSTGVLKSTMTPTSMSVYAGSYITLQTNFYGGVETSPQVYVEKFGSDMATAITTQWWLGSATTPKQEIILNANPESGTTKYINRLRNDTLILDDNNYATTRGTKLYYHK